MEVITSISLQDFVKGFAVLLLGEFFFAAAGGVEVRAGSGPFFVAGIGIGRCGAGNEAGGHAHSVGGGC